MSELRDALAVYRLTRLATSDHLTQPARDAVAKHLGGRGRYFLTCPWCWSPWIAVGAYLLRRRFPDLWDAISATMAASAVAGIVSSRV